MSPGSRTQIFISYSHQDKSHLERLQVHLEPFRRAGIDIWDDTRIAAGQQWRHEIEQALAKTKVAILLVSADFLASKFIAENELPPLLASASTGGTLILPVVVGACNFGASALSSFQAVNIPSKPLNSMTRPKREEVWSHVAKVASDALAGTYYTNQVHNLEANVLSDAHLGKDTVLGDELDTLIALQQTLQNAPKGTHFPYFIRPVGPLFATNEEELRKAQQIRRRVLRMFIDEADTLLAPGDTSSDEYHGYMAQIAYLRSMFSVDQWLRFEGMEDTLDIMLEIAEEFVPILPLLPKTEAECYQQEQLAVAQVRYDLSHFGARTVRAYPRGKEELYGE
jgi:hypothetical protein